MNKDFVEDRLFSPPRNRYGKKLRVLRVPRYMVENNSLLSEPSCEERIIAKDFIYKFVSWLKNKKEDRSANSSGVKYVSKGVWAANWMPIISLYHCCGMTMKEVASILNISESCVSISRKLAINKFSEGQIPKDK